MISLEDGKKLVKLARDSILSTFDGKKTDLKEYSKYNALQGVFVTLHSKCELRGCIGFPTPVYPLKDAVNKAAIAAAFEDTRFSPLQKKEFKDVNLEISVLSVPEKIVVRKPEDYAKKIRVGKDGLIVKNKCTSGLLLPQVAPEWGWDAQEFLEETCHKAGLARTAWKETDTEVYKFQAQIFCEEKGNVVERK